MFYIIGIGLGDAEDITVKGLNIVQRAFRVYLEAYTSILSVGKEVLEQFYGREIIVADRELVEQGAEVFLEEAKEKDIALLVVGDPFGATTHTDILLRAQELGVKFEIVHNASILNAVGCCGLQLYSFGETVSIPFWTATWQPDSFFEKIVENKRRGLHTLCLLDIKIKEPTLESLTKKKKEFNPPTFMSVSQASNQLLEIINRKESNEDVLASSSLCIGLARVGCKDQKIVACSLLEMKSTDLGLPLHSLVICGGQLHPLEKEYILRFMEQSR